MLTHILNQRRNLKTISNIFKQSSYLNFLSKKNFAEGLKEISEKEIIDTEEIKINIEPQTSGSTTTFEILKTFLNKTKEGAKLVDDVDKLIFDKFQDVLGNKQKELTLTSEFQETLNYLINEKLKNELRVLYSSTKHDVFQKDALLKKILDEIDSKKKQDEQKCIQKKNEKDYKFEELSEEEKQLYKLLNKEDNKKKKPQIAKDKADEPFIPDIKFLKNQYEEAIKTNLDNSRSIKKFSPNYSFADKKKLWTHIDTYYDKKDLKFDVHEFNKIELEQKVAAPSLSMNLINVVQNPGIYPLSSIKKLNKTTSLHLLEKLPTPEQISFENLDTYMRPHEDPNLKILKKKYNYKYSSSTSGISEALAHFFYKLTNFKSPHFYNLSENYINEPLKFMMFQRKPSSIVLHKIDKQFYSISKNNVFESKIEFILLKMGKYMEKIFTNSPEEFEKKYMKSSKSSGKNEIVLKEDDYFKFIGYDNIILRSQIDCGGKDKEGRDIVFEIKTRAVAPIRYDVHNYLDYLDYEVNSLHGRHSSYEREFYDLIRGAFLKYLFQLKIGGMSGALVSYHNTQKIFGFEYISLVDMERRILGNSNFSDVIFKASLKLLQETLDVITKDFPDQDRIFIGFFGNEWKGTIDVFVEIVNEDSYKDYEQTNTREVIDYYYITGYRPKVHKYTIHATPILNNVITTFSPILYENNDTYHVKYQVIYSGEPSFDEYMKFLHESFMQKDNFNLLNQFSGSWSSSYER